MAISDRLGAGLVLVGRLSARIRSYFAQQDPTFWTALTPALVVAALVYVRSPTSNYIFDEQEALLANPYVNGESLAWLDAFKRDFWGLPPTRSIGSYRPIPNLIWRSLWHISGQPWLHHWVNVIVHAVNAALVSSTVLALARRRRLAWLAGASFLLSAVITEAVTGVVGIADVLGGLGVLLAVAALRVRLWAMPAAVFGAVALGLFCKESSMVAVGLVPWVALVASPALHSGRPLRLLRAALALVGATGALVSYTYFRRHFFPVTLPEELRASLPDSEPLVRRAMHAFLQWFQQPRLPSDPINNPLVDADFPHRVAGALRVFWRGLTQVVAPLHLSGDYSFPHEPIPTRLFTVESVLGGCCLLLAPLTAVGLWVRALVLELRERADRATQGGVGVAPTSSMLLAIGFLWVAAAYFPHSNIPVVLPTVRAERFWYLPVMGTALVVAVAFDRLLEWRRHPRAAAALVAVFLGFQGLQARRHAIDYTSDLMFWDATRRAAANSAKAHLNYSVMVGARGRLEERLASNRRALELAPKWPMAHVYYGDTLCRLGRTKDAWPHYVRGFELDPGSSNLIALALQCLWDKKGIADRTEELLALSDRYPGSWLAYLATEIVYSGEKHGGVEPQYRPRGYNEGPKQR